jgi:heat-inducible transcriptional repressor
MTVVITDAGRVEQRLVESPSDVDPLLLAEVRTRINAEIEGLALGDAASRLAELAAQFTPEQQPVVAQITATLVQQMAENRTDRLVITGTANLVRTEDDFSGSIYPVLEAIEEQVTLLKLFGEISADRNGMSVSIGRENAEFGLGETSVLTSGYASTGGTVARLGVLGPTRMDYSNNMAAVRAVARYLSKLLGDD